MTLVSSLGTTFRPFNTGAMVITPAVAGVGGVTLAGGAANGSLSQAAQVAGSSTLGKVITGAAEKAAIGGGGISRALVPASSIASATDVMGGIAGGFGKFLQSPLAGVAGGLLTGVGTGIAGYLQQRQAEKQQKAVTDSYKVGSSALHGADIPSGAQPAAQTPAQKWTRPVYKYNAESGAIDRRID